MPDTASFRPELFEFLRQLKHHNNRESFAKNKARYHELVVEPPLLFIDSFAPHLYKLSPFFLADARPTRGSLFRIYRDIRFAADKRPFKTHVGIHFHQAAGGCLEPPPAERLRGAYPHLSYSMKLTLLHGTSRAGGFSV
jgi:uncharacterized protein (TIGR02453 family)